MILTRLFTYSYAQFLTNITTIYGLILRETVNGVFFDIFFTIDGINIEIDLMKAS